MGIKKIFNNKLLSVSIIYILTSFLVRGISFLTTPIFTRLMGTADYGIVSNFTTWVSFFNIFIFCQISSGLLVSKVNHCNRNQERFNQYVKHVVLFGLISACIQTGIIIIFRNPLSKLLSLDQKLIPLMCVGAVGSAMVNVITQYYIASDRPKAKVVFSVVSTLSFVVFGLIFVFYLPDKAVGRIIGFTVNYAAIALYGIIILLGSAKISIQDFKTDVKFGLAFGIPLIPHLLANLVNGSADKVFIIKILGESENGIYSVAYSIGMLALSLADASGDAWNPWYFEKTKTKDDKGIGKSFMLYSTTLGFFFIGVMYLAYDIMRFMAPQSYWSGTRCVLFVALGVFFLLLYRFPLAYEQFMANTKYVAPATILAAISNITLNALLIPKYGINGAAIATTVSYVFLWLFHEIVARKIIKGYNIEIHYYLPIICFALTAFILSNYLLYISIGRYLVLVIYCIGYLFFIKRVNNMEDNEE